MKQPAGKVRRAWFWVGVILLVISALWWLILILASEDIGATILAGVVTTVIPIAIGIYGVRRGRKAPDMVIAGDAEELDEKILSTVRWGSAKKPDHEEIWAIIYLKQGGGLAVTTDRLILARGSIAMGGFASGLKRRFKEEGLEKVLAELTAEGVLGMDKRNIAIPWSEVTKVDVHYRSFPFTEDQGLLWVFTVNNKKYPLFVDDKRALCELWHILNATIPDKVVGPKNRDKFDREMSKLGNTPVDVWVAHLRSLGFEAEIYGLEEKDKRVAAYLNKGVAAIKGRNIAYIVNQRVRLNWIVTCVLPNIAGNWEYTRTKKRGKQGFEWVGDKKISDVLSQDTSIKNALLEGMQAKEVDVVGITQPKDNSAVINLLTKERLPSGRLLEAVDRIAGYLYKIA